MSLATEILKRKPSNKKASKPSLVLDDSMPVAIGGTEEKVLTIAEASKAFAEHDAKLKELEAVKGSFADALKVAGVKALREAEKQGKYYAAAIAGMAQITRQNKYQPITEANKDRLVQELGAVEYATLFTEKATIEFDSLDAMRGFIQQCAALGMVVPGNVVETIVPRSTFVERKCQLASLLPAEKVVLIDAIAERTTFAIGKKKEEVHE